MDRRRPFNARAMSWQVVGYLAMAFIVIMMGIPLFWMLTGSLKTLGEIYTFPPVWIPNHPQWSNFSDAWNRAPFERFYLNSIITTFIGMSIELVNATLTAYALAFLRFPYKRLVFILILAALMIPSQVTILPNFLTMANLDWVNTYQGIILPGASVAFGTFLLRQYFMGLPKDVLDAAKVDGCSHLRLLWSVVIPMSKPVLVTFGLLSIVWKWNEFLWTLVITNTLDMRTLPIGIAYLFDVEGNTQWGVVMAGTIFVVAPMLVIFLLAQRYIVEGITAGATKG
ncbi:MAG: carbohydrate ABC transporter permease [Sphaerobacteraceae bacterium]|nr:MAG: carbohydrate ABC transporter permease [Sphaerobacteraceae bacterium]